MVRDSVTNGKFNNNEQFSNAFMQDEILDIAILTTSYNAYQHERIRPSEILNNIQQPVGLKRRVSALYAIWLEVK